jgi:predicted Na+-dependent transporter
MQKGQWGRQSWGSIVAIIILAAGLFLCPSSKAKADTNADAAFYRHLTQIAAGQGDITLFENLNRGARKLDWERAVEKTFAGHLRVIRVQSGGDNLDRQVVYLLRELTGKVHILGVPEDPHALAEDSGSPYAGLDGKFENKLIFHARLTSGNVGGTTYSFARLIDLPVQPALDRVFRLSIILMLFFVMVGMGLTLTFKDFALVFTKPRGIILGEILQFGFMPLMAMAIGHLLGFYQQYPFIFVGMILITAIPGGVTSNLMTYYAKGDLALSISLTSFSTVLSIIFTPLLLALYCANMPEVIIPVKTVIQTIMILVIVPLAVGMSLRGKWPRFAIKATPFFSALGIIALLALIAAGVLSNIHIFKDTARYGVKFYTSVFALTFIGMMFGIVFSKMLGINNYQTRAISLETGLRNSALAMTIALLIQDAMGDFYSSMFVTSGLFGLIMYLAGVIAIFLYKPLLPVDKE